MEQGHISGDGDSGESEGACAKPAQKRPKSKSRVWEKVAWFTRRSRSRDNPSEGASMADSETASLPPDHMDFDLSPTNSTSDNSPLNSMPWLESSSSSDGELFDAYHDGSRIKRSRLYPNSEIIEQNCLKPSIARALFLQMEATNYRNGKGQKNAWQKKKKKSHSIPRSDSLFNGTESQSSEDLLSRTVSMPHEIGNKSAACHCPACCTCTPAQRLMGMCPAHARLSTSTASLDTGLSLSSHCAKPLLPIPPQEQHLPSTSGNIQPPPEGDTTMSENPPTEGATVTPIPSSAVRPSFDTNIDLNQFKSNSLPMYYGKRCKMCNKPTYRPHLPNCDRTLPQDIVPGLSVCQCNTQISCTKTSTSAASGGGNDPVSSSSSGGNAEKKSEIFTKDRINPTEFRNKTELIKEWFGEFNDEQKNLLLKELLACSSLPQIHLLSLEMAPRLHEGCPENCQDLLTWLPHSVTLSILSYLDPVSLCRASGVCKSWYHLANDPSLWRQYCCLAKWRLSRTGEQKQLLQTMMPNGNVEWKQVFSERYRLRHNWLRGKCYVRTFEGHTQGISCVQFDDTRIVSGSSDKTIKVWNIRTNSPWSVQTLVGHSGTVRCLHLQGNRLVSGSTDRTIKVWDLSTQQSWSSIACKVTMVGHLDTVRCLQVDEEKVISGSYDKTLKVWDIRTGQCHMTLRGHGAAVLCVQFDDQKIVSGSCDKYIKVWNNQGDCLMTLQGHHDAVTCLQFDETRIISGSLDCNLKFWDIHTGDCINTIDWKASEGHTGVVRCLQADSWRVVSASDDRTLKVWNLETGERLVTLRNHTDGVTCLQFNDSIIVSGSYDKTVKLWDFSCC